VVEFHGAFHSREAGLPSYSAAQTTAKNPGKIWTVAVPDFQTLMRSLLALTDDGEEHEVADLRGQLAEEFGLTDADLEERIPSGRVTTMQNRVGWAATYLYRCGLLESAGDR
jgi:hypothetical protein